MGDDSLDRQNLELLKRYCHNQDFEAYQQILIINDKLNYHIAKKFLNSGEDLDDLAGISRIGMIKAIKSFDPDKKIKFATYATRCMTNEILMFMRKTKKHKTNVSLEQPLTTDVDGNELKLEDIVDSGAGDLIDSYIEQEDLYRLRKAIAELEGRDRAIIEELYLKGKTQKQVAKILGISQSYISRIEKKVLKKLKKNFDNTKGEITMSNKISNEKVQELNKQFDMGVKPAEAGRVVGVSYTTAYKYYKKHTMTPVEAPEVKEEVKKQDVVEAPKEPKIIEMKKMGDYTPKVKSQCANVSLALTRASKGEIQSVLNSLMLTVNEEESYNIDILITKEVS